MLLDKVGMLQKQSFDRPFPNLAVTVVLPAFPRGARFGVGPKKYRSTFWPHRAG
jgi:hypothetical protein